MLNIDKACRKNGSKNTIYEIYYCIYKYLTEFINKKRIAKNYIGNYIIIVLTVICDFGRSDAQVSKTPIVKHVSHNH